MAGNVTQFVDFLTSSGDTGGNNDASIQPIVNGELVTAEVMGRPDQNLRRRTEVLRAAAADSAYLRDADRGLIIAGPGRVTWPGSITAGQSGVPSLSDVLWILPMLTPGAAQAAPVPPVASAYGTLRLKRASDGASAIIVTSQRRSYAGGDQINVTVIAGPSFLCSIDAEDAGTSRRTIKVVATPTTTVGTVISALNALAPPAPDSAPLVVASLDVSASSSDVILSPQARQFVFGNHDGEGHTLAPAALASFFASNPTQALAEGDTLCAQFAMLVDAASTGGRRQALPENSNTAITAGMLFNSRVHPEKLVNAIPICKAVSGALVFATGIEIPAGSIAAPLSPRGAANLSYEGGPAWADGTANPATTVEAQLDKIVSDLATGDGSAKVSYGGGPDWADGSANPATTIGIQLDKIVSDLADTTGGAKVGGAAVGGGTTLAEASLSQQIADLAVNWGKKAIANTWGGTQTFNAGLVVPNGQDIVLQGDARVVHGTRTVRFVTSNAGASFLSGSAPSNERGAAFGTGSTAVGRWLYPFNPWPAHWRMTSARIFLSNTVVGAGGVVSLVEVVGPSDTFNVIATYTFVGGESGLINLTGVVSATHVLPIALIMNLTVGSTTTALITFTEVDYDVQP